MPFVYLLESKKDGKFYIGSTDNIKRRLVEHNKGRVKSTKHRIPFIVKYYKNFDTINKARYLEWKLKHSAHQKKLFLKEAGVK